MVEILLKLMRQNEWTVQWVLFRKLMDCVGKKVVEKFTQYTKMGVD